jgi:lipopolysaccharide transport system permease protein
MASTSISTQAWAPLALFGSLWRNRPLLARLAKREIQARYRGSLLGFTWLVLLPLLMLGVYTFAFAVVFKARWSTSQASMGAFAVVLFCGLAAFAIFSDMLNRAPTLILEHAAYVKKVVFPLELLPWVTLAVSLFGFAINLVVLAAFYPWVFGAPPWTVVFVPVLIAPLCLVSLGLSWFFASVGVFVRDLKLAVGVITTIVMFTSPIFYPLDAVPEAARAIIAWNPMAHVLEQLRGAVFWGKAPDPLALGLELLVGWAIAALGFAWFRRTRKAFADVL